MRKRMATPQVTRNWLVRQMENRFRIKLIGAAVVCLAIVGSLYAINRSRPPITAVSAVEVSTSCDTGVSSAHAGHASESISEVDAAASTIEPPLINTVSAPTPAPEGMVWIPGGEFSMRSEDPEMRDARPFHRVAVDAFWMDRTEVTNVVCGRFGSGNVLLDKRRNQSEAH